MRPTSQLRRVGHIGPTHQNGTAGVESENKLLLTPGRRFDTAYHSSGQTGPKTANSNPTRAIQSRAYAAVPDMVGRKGRRTRNRREKRTSRRESPGTKGHRGGNLSRKSGVRQKSLWIETEKATQLVSSSQLPSLFWRQPFKSFLTHASNPLCRPPDECARHGAGVRGISPQTGVSTDSGGHGSGLSLRAFLSR
jgi:hypothetical protein